MFVQLRVNIRDVQQCDVCDRVFGRRARVQRIGIRLFRARARRDDQQQRGEEAQRVMTPSGSKRKDRKHSTTKELWERKITPRWSVHEENEGEHALYSAIMQIYRIFKFSPKKRHQTVQKSHDQPILMVQPVCFRVGASQNSHAVDIAAYEGCLKSHRSRPRKSTVRRLRRRRRNEQRKLQKQQKPQERGERLCGSEGAACTAHGYATRAHILQRALLRRRRGRRPRTTASGPSTHESTRLRGNDDEARLRAVLARRRRSRRFRGAVRCLRRTGLAGILAGRVPRLGAGSEYRDRTTRWAFGLLRRSSPSKGCGERRCTWFQLLYFFYRSFQT